MVGLMDPIQEFLAALYVKLFIELFVHGQYDAGDADACREKALDAAKAATEFYYTKSQQEQKDGR